MTRHVVTLIAPPHAAPLRANPTLIAAIRARLNPVRVVWLSAHACDMECSVPAAPVWNDIARMADEARLDAVLQPADGRIKRLLVSDMDSTMIAQECIDELADAVGMRAHVAAITERAMNGELDFAAALTERVALLKDLPVSELEHTYQSRISLMPGARTLVHTMRMHGAKTVLVSGGFTFFTSRVAEAIGFEWQEANQLEIVDGRLTGRVVPPILDKQAKLATLKLLAAKYRMPLSATIAVGDGANDLPMIQAAGLGVAYRAKPVVEAAAPASIRHGDLTALLYLQGIPEKDWVAQENACLAA